MRSVVGHGFETPYYEDTLARVAAFYSITMAIPDRSGLLAEYNVAYVWWGPNERALGDFDPGALPGLAPIFETNDVTIYAVIDGP